MKTNKITISIFIAIALIGLIGAGGILTKTLNFNSNTVDSLSAKGITSFDMGEITCKEDYCITSISKDGYFKTDVKTDRYKSVQYTNSTCEEIKTNELKDLNETINTTQITEDCKYSQTELKTNDDIKTSIDEATKQRMNEISSYFATKEIPTKIDDAKIIEITK